MSQQLHDYVTSQLRKGFSREQIKQALLASGWPAQEIDNYFLTIPTVSPSPAFSLQKYAKFILPAVLVLVIIAGSTFYLLRQNASVQDQIPETVNETQTESSTPSSASSPSDQPSSASTGATFEEHLSTCSQYKDTFEHPLTGEAMEREIVGETDDKCLYVEQMPNGGKMECRYTEYERRAVAQFHLDEAAAELSETSIHMDGTKVTAEYTLDGKVVENPLAEALENGTCVISGY
ncbi:hypothetical protein IPM65_03080 [Candidatus Roizmanbacteria bacterium]|nr:MAG: hypothetical protein IPM65_03080 [Candidatus Roizmanbacteria bacterium]